MISGPRIGRRSALRRWMAGALSSQLDAFVVPGREILIARGLDPAAAGLRLMASPRHASVLVLVGDIPPGLARAAAVAYVQQPRPRAILAVGTSSAVGPLPAADVLVEASQAAFAAGVAELRRRMAAGAWAPDPPAFEIREADDFTSGPAIDTGPHTGHAMHHERTEDARALSHGTGAHGAAGQDPPGNVGSSGSLGIHSDGAHHASTEPAQSAEMVETDPGDTAGMDPADMAGMDHGDMAGGLMSMEMMTRDLPRSADGLPMEWLEVPFGPLFPGLPGGLGLVLMLDGDTVARAEVRGGILTRGLARHWRGSATSFPDRFTRIDPLAFGAYRVLARRALEQAAGIEVGRDEACRRITALEGERATSHLIWLAHFGFLVGDAWLAERASTLARRVRIARDLRRITELRADIAAFVATVRRTPLLKRRLSGVGYIEPAHAVGLVGPVARGSGRGIDARAEDPDYLSLGFAPVIQEGSDALARLMVRVAEIEQSLGLILAAGAGAPSNEPKLADTSGVGTARVETPRGEASLTATLDGGNVVEVALETPSSRHVHLVKHVAMNRELSDALLGVVSLDLSPWELDR